MNRIEEEERRKLEGVGKTSWERKVWIELCPLENLYVEALNANGTVFGDRVFKEVIRLNEVVRVDANPI